MERKLELADIAGYLPYGLKFKNCDRFAADGGGILFVHGLIVPNVIFSVLSDDTEAYFRFSESKPLLRPMTDLTKPMTHPGINDGEEFIPAQLISEMYYKRDVYVQCTHIGEENICVDMKPAYVLGSNRINGYSVPFVPFIASILSMLHFDYNNLIGQGLAIDINTIE